MDLERVLGAAIVERRRVGGGSINDTSCLELADGRTVFMKTNDAAPEDMFPEEARGLSALGAAKGPPVPEVIHVDASCLVLEYLVPGRTGPEGWARLGEDLARLHRATGEAHGFFADNYIGSTPQQNPWTEDGVAFFAEHRIAYQVDLAERRGLLEARDVRAAERLIGRLPELLPESEPPSLLHGDLWTGNVHGRSDGVACLVDPAACYGLREGELAMTRLFGRLPDRFYDAYEASWPLPPGAPERVPLFNLYHLLNHLNLFGTGYLGEVRAVLERYA